MPRGEEVLTEEFDPPPDGPSESRLVFFLHFLSLQRPLLTPAGPVELPAPTAAPPRLAGVGYEPVDKRLERSEAASDAHRRPKRRP